VTSDRLTPLREAVQRAVERLPGADRGDSIPAEQQVLIGEIRAALQRANDDPQSWKLVSGALRKLHAAARRDFEQGTPSVPHSEPLLETFRRDILEPLCGKGLSDPAVRLDLECSPEGVPTVRIRHTAICTAGTEDGQPTPCDFDYHIVFGDVPRPALPLHPLPAGRGAQLLILPRDSWQGGKREASISALRQVFIGDPRLNARYTTEGIAAEPFQERAVQAVKAAWKRKNKSLVVMATATGKTIVAWCAVKQRVEEQRAAQLPTGKTLFILNNNKALGEAAGKLRDVAAGAVTSSTCYDGRRDFSGDVILATPAALMEGGALAQLMAQHRIDTVIFDETHHLPAPQNREIYRTIEERSARLNWDTKFLGLTATDIRPDRQSVIEFFGHEVDYDYSALEGRADGYLTKMVYELRDYDLNPNDEFPFLEGTDLHRHYVKGRYHSDRYLALFQDYFDTTRSLIDKRGLFLCPNIKKAEELAGFFRGKGVQSVALTGATGDRELDEQYYAWKHGRWPRGSKHLEFRTPVPQVVMGVDMFREAIDVPGINYLGLWADTNSIIEFIQSIGRGLRAAPFKSLLIVRDFVGLLRKRHIMDTLYLSYQPRDRLGGGGDPREQEDADIEIDEMPLVVRFDPGQKNLMDRYLDDLPGCLAARYFSYNSVPLQEMLRLDRFIANRSGFGDEEEAVGALRAHMAEVAAALSGANPEGLKRLRERLIPAFFSAGIFEREDVEKGLEIPYAGPTAIVFHRFEALLREAAPTLADDGVLRLFPEFDPKREVAARQIAKNLRTLRTVVFGLSITDTTKRFIADLLESKLLPRDEPLAQWLEQDSFSLSKNMGDLVTLDFAESSSRTRDGDGGREALSRAGRFGTFGAGQWQHLAIALYNKLPELQGKTLTLQDLAQNSDTFRRLLQQRGLAGGDLDGPAKIANALDRRISAYEAAVNQEDEARITTATRALSHDLSRCDVSDLCGLGVMKPGFVQDLQRLDSKFHELVTRRGEKVSAEERALRSAFGEFIASTGVRITAPIPSVSDLTLVAERKLDKGVDCFQLRLGGNAPLDDDLRQGFLLEVVLRRDAIGNVVCFVCPPSDYRGQRHISTVERLALRHGREQGSLVGDELVDGFMTIFHQLQALFEESVVPVIPLDQPGNRLFRDLLDAISRHTEWDVVGQLDRIALLDPKRGALRFSHVRMRGTRLLSLDPMGLARVRHAARSVRGDSADPIDALHLIYLAQCEYTRELLPLWGTATQKLALYQPATPILRQIAKRVSLEGQRIFTQTESLSSAERTRARELLSILAVGEPEAPLSDAQVALACAHLMCGRMGEPTAWSTPGSGLRAEAVRLFQSYGALLQAEWRAGAKGAEAVLAQAEEPLLKVGLGIVAAVMSGAELPAELNTQILELAGRFDAEAQRLRTGTRPLLTVGATPLATAVGTEVRDWKDFVRIDPDLQKIMMIFSSAPNVQRTPRRSVSSQIARRSVPTPSRFVHWDHGCAALVGEKHRGFQAVELSVYQLFEASVPAGEWQLCKTCHPPHPGDQTTFPVWLEMSEQAAKHQAERRASGMVAPPTTVHGEGA